jgi:signal transduction histidine kinase
MRRAFWRDSVSARLLGAFFLVSIVPLVVAGILVYREAEATLREELWERLGTVTQVRIQQIHAWLDLRQQDVIRPTTSGGFGRAVATVAASRAPNGRVVDEVRAVLEQTRVSGGFTDVFLLNLTDGMVLASSDRAQEGRIERDRPYVREGRRAPYVHVDYSTATALQRAVAFSAPVIGSRSQPTVILVARADLRYLDDLMAERAGLGTTGHMFLVNRFHSFVSSSLGSGQDGGRPVFSEGVKRVLAGESGTAVYQNHERRTVVGAYRPIPQIGIALIAETDADEAFAPIYRFRIGLVVLLVVVCVVAGLIGIRLAWGISRPITGLVRAAVAIGDGDLGQRVMVAGPREVTALARAFNGMAQDLARSRTELMAHSTALEGKVADRTRNLTALLEVTQALGSTLDLTETLRRAARSLVRVLWADAGVAYVLEDDGERLRPVAGYHLPPSLRTRSATMPLMVRTHAFVAEACESRQAMFAEDAPVDPRLDPVLIEVWQFRSVLFVPMFARGRLVGGLFAGWGASRPSLTTEELTLIEGIGRQAGIAVQNAALFAEREQRRRGAEALAELDAVLARSLDSDIVADGIVRGTRSLLDSRFAAVYRLDPGSGDLVSLAVDGDGHGDAATVLPRGSGICGVAVEERDVIVSADILSDARIALSPALRERVADGGYPAMLAAPLRVGERVVGALCIGDHRGRVFTPEETRLVRTFATQAALALENARFYDEAQARAARMTRLSELGRLITSSLDLRQVLDRVAAAARELLDGDLARVWVADPDAQVVRLMASQDRGGNTVPGDVTELPLGVGVVGFVMTERRRHYSWDLAAEPFDAADGLKAAGYTSQLAVPLIVGDRAVGVLLVLTKAAREFAREDEEILALFASEAGTAVENARLFADTEAQAAVLAKKNAELDSFTHSVSHDLKAPLVTIQAMCGLVLEDYGDRLDAEGRRVLGRIEANAAHMGRLIADLLALSKIGREARTPQAVAVGDVVEVVLDRLSEQIRARGVEVAGAVDATVWGIRVHIEQVFTNVIGNAIKYLGDRPAPRVEIGAEDRGRFLEFWVRDNGIGIDPAYHARVFELFQRLQEVDAEGTGVGLALVKKIVDTAGGRIWVESTPGEGATFRFTLPSAAARVA